MRSPNRKASWTSILIACFLWCAPVHAQESKIAAGNTITAWKGVLMTGEVQYSTATRSGNGRIEAWWIVKPWGYTSSVKQLGRRGRIDIPWYGLWSELRVRASEDSVIDVRDDGTPRKYGDAWHP